MTLFLLAALALAEPPEPSPEPAPEPSPAERSAVPGTVDNPLRIRITQTSVDKANDTLQREWDKIERALLDLQDSLYGEADKTSRSVGIEPGKPIRIRANRDLHVYIEQSADRERVTLRVEDEAGEPIDDVERATVQVRGEEERELVLAKSSEVVIEDLEYADGTAVRLYVGDGDVILIWLEEDAAP